MAYTWLLKNFTLGATDDCLPKSENHCLVWNGISSCTVVRHRSQLFI